MLVRGLRETLEMISELYTELFRKRGVLDMYIANNVIANALKNVYWVLGGATGGKTTAARILSEKYGMVHYNADEKMWNHKQIAIPSEQPAFCRHFSSWEEYFGRPIDEYSKWLADMNDEAASMHIVELIQIARDSKVVFEGIISLDLVKSISDYNRIVYLHADEDVVRKAYFDRQDKDDMYQLIKTLSNPLEIIDKIYQMVIDGSKEGLEKAKGRGLKIIYRDMNNTVSGMMAQIEEHFGL
jgi:hypothetical protein